MNETIGSKGGRNDLRRSLKIKKQKKKRLQELHREEELKKLEKRVRKLQRVTLIKVLPIALAGEVFKSLINNTKGSKVEVLNDNIDIIPLENNDKLEKKEVREVKEIKISKEVKEELVKATNKKIVLEYEEKLKDVRLNLRKAYFEYKSTSLEEKDREEKEDIEDKRVEEVVDKVSLVINKVDNLGEKIVLKDNNLLNDNYLSNEVNSYIEEDKEDILQENDSSLYKDISKKIEEVSSKEAIFTNKALEQEEKLLLEDVDIAALKEKYYDYDKFNKMLIEFQNEQDYLLKEVKEKVKNSLSIEEKVKVEVEAMDKESKRLFRLLALQMFLPGLRSAKMTGMFSATYLYFVHNIMKSNVTTRKYKVINVKDYSRDIEKSLSATNDISKFLGKTENELLRTIREIKVNYSDYLDLEEVKSLLNNLDKVRDDLKEKEYEIDKLRKEQKLILEKNNAKVLKYRQ